MRQKVSGFRIASPIHSNDETRRAGLRSVAVATACGLALALLNGSAWAYRPGGGQTFAAPPPRPAPVAAPRVAPPRLPPEPPAPAPAVLPPSGAWILPTPSAAQAPSEEAPAAPDAAPPYQPTRSPTVFAVLMLVGGSAALGAALARSRRTGNEPNVGHAVVPAPVAPVEAPGSPLPRMGDLIQGKYRVGTELSRDELGVMFHGCHEALDVRVRLYFLLPEHADSPEARAQLWEKVQGWAGATSDPERRVIDAATTEDGRVFVVFATASRPA